MYIFLDLKPPDYSESTVEAPPPSYATVFGESQGYPPSNPQPQPPLPHPPPLPPPIGFSTGIMHNAPSTPTPNRVAPMPQPQ